MRDSLYYNTQICVPNLFFFSLFYTFLLTVCVYELCLNVRLFWNFIIKQISSTFDIYLLSIQTSCLILFAFLSLSLSLNTSLSFFLLHIYKYIW